MKNPKPEFVTVVVLNDGETFTDVRGCSLCVIPLEQYESVVNSGGDAKDFAPVVEIGLDTLSRSYPST
jgi:hypothetical protein